MALSQPDFVFLYVLPFFAFIIGASIGSFLNVVIYRVPNGLSVNEPKRSFCPDCNKQIPAHYNLPLISWLMLRGRCKWCDKPIAFRYFMVELLTGICFLALWKLAIGEMGLGGVVSLWILASLLISATFIDFDHFIIPDGITIGGTVVGIVASVAFPVLHKEEIWWRGGMQSLIGAAVLRCSISSCSWANSPLVKSNTSSMSRPPLRFRNQEVKRHPS